MSDADEKLREILVAWAKTVNRPALWPDGSHKGELEYFSGPLHEAITQIKNLMLELISDTADEWGMIRDSKLIKKVEDL